jgi:hypothetical protein
MLEEIGEVNALHKSYVEQAGFAVLKAPDVPSPGAISAGVPNVRWGSAPSRPTSRPGWHSLPGHATRYQRPA